MNLLQAQSAVVLAYHHVANDTPASTTISPADFRGHLEYLRDNDFRVLPLPQLVDDLRQGNAIDDKAVAITFDDGYVSIFETAFPLLTEFGFPFTIFLSTGPIDRDQSNYMDWNQLREMSDAGVVIANHLAEHPYMLERLENESPNAWIERQREEINHAQSRILLETGQDFKMLAYPYGEYNQEIKALVSTMGFTAFAQNSGAINANSDFLALPRFPLASIYANLETASTKIWSKAFDVKLLAPTSPVTQSSMPTATLQFAPGNYRLEQINCFNSGQAMSLNWRDKEQGILEIQATTPNSGRRWRYICTAPDRDSSRFFWTSVQWINPNN